MSVNTNEGLRAVLTQERRFVCSAHLGKKVCVQCSFRKWRKCSAHLENGKSKGEFDKKKIDYKESYCNGL